MSLRHAALFIPAAAVLVAGLALVQAGDLTPPNGAVQPSMRTLDEIYNRIGQVGSQDGCDGGPWESLVTNEVGDTVTEIVSGSGLLHAVITPEGRTIRLLSQAGGDPIAVVGTAAGLGHGRYVLNVRFENGLSIQAVGATSSSLCTVLYRPD